MARASARVVGSGTVGPEPITLGSSPGTSEMATAIRRAGCARSASRPPLMRERCLRTTFISPIDGAGGEQRPRHRLLLAERQAGGGRDPVRRRAARDQRQHQIVGAGGVGERQRLEGGGETGGVGHRMPGLDDAHRPRRTPVAAARDRKTGDAVFRHAALVEIVTLGHLGHRRAGLAGREDDEPSGAWRVRQVRRQAGRRMRGVDRRAEQAFEKGAGRCDQRSSSDAVGRSRRSGQGGDRRCRM